MFRFQTPQPPRTRENTITFFAGTLQRTREEINSIPKRRDRIAQISRYTGTLTTIRMIVFLLIELKKIVHEKIVHASCTHSLTEKQALIKKLEEAIKNKLSNENLGKIYRLYSRPDFQECIGDIIRECSRNVSNMGMAFDHVPLLFHFNYLIDLYSQLVNGANDGALQINDELVLRMDSTPFIRNAQLAPFSTNENDKKLHALLLELSLWLNGLYWHLHDNIKEKTTRIFINHKIQQQIQHESIIAKYVRSHWRTLRPIDPILATQLPEHLLDAWLKPEFKYWLLSRKNFKNLPAEIFFTIAQYLCPELTLPQIQTIYDRGILSTYRSFYLSDLNIFSRFSRCLPGTLNDLKLLAYRANSLQELTNELGTLWPSLNEGTAKSLAQHYHRRLSKITAPQAQEEPKTTPRIG